MTTGKLRRGTWLAIAVIGAGAAALLFLPTTTRRGVNYRVTTSTIPAYVKAIDFIQRHYQYELLVSRICSAGQSESDCVLALFDWTHANVRPVPAGLPVIDDHPLHVVIRGYGTSDQAADVFSILAVYAGVPAFARWLAIDRARLDLAFAYLGGKWVPFDVTRHIAFRDRHGALAGVDELLRDPGLVEQQTAGVRHQDVPYSAFISARMLEPFTVPATNRGELQQPWARLRFELRHALRAGG